MRIGDLLCATKYISFDFYVNYSELFCIDETKEAFLNSKFPKKESRINSRVSIEYFRQKIASQKSRQRKLNN